MRKTVIPIRIIAALGLIFTFSLQSCSTIKTVNAFEENGELIIEKSEFFNPETKIEYSSIMVTSNYIRKPIILYKVGTDSYDAYSLECTFDGDKLSVTQSKLECETDGSIYNQSGEVLKGPANRNLKRYVIDKTATTIKIKIK